MKNHTLSGCVVVALLVPVISVSAQELTKIDSEKLQPVAQQLSKEAAKIEKPQVRIEADPANAVGLRYKKDGIIAIPQKGLKADSISNAANTETGAAFAFLFMSESFAPVVDGGRVDDSKLRTVKLTDNQGNERTIKCLLLAVRQISGDDWRLYVYGSAKKPLVEAKFSARTTGVTQPILLKVDDVQGSEGTLKVLIFGKHQAGLRIGYEQN